MKLWTAHAAVLAICALATDAHAHPSAAEAEAHARNDMQSSLAVIDGVAMRVRTLLQRARGRGALAEALCVDANLTRVNVSQRVAREHAQRAAAASSLGDSATARWEVARVIARRDLAKDAGRAAGACALPDFAPAQNATSVRVWIDPTLPTDVAGYPDR